MRVPMVIVIALALLATACGGKSDERQYTLQGQVLSVAPDRMRSTIKHEAITGLMPAMTMSYKAADERQFADIKPGDLITSTLVIVTNDGYLKDVKKVGEAPLERAPDESPSTASGLEMLQPGETVPNAEFVDQDGRKRDMTSFSNSTLLVTFIYTRCPMPTFCPLMDRQFATIQGKLQTEPALKNVHLLSVSFDPVADTPAVLKKHAQSLGADPKYWTFLTGDVDGIDRFAKRFGVVTMREPDAREITHNLRTAIVDRRGVLAKAYTGNEWTPEQILADLNTVASAE